MAFQKSLFRKEAIHSLSHFLSVTLKNQFVDKYLLTILPSAVAWAFDIIRGERPANIVDARMRYGRLTMESVALGMVN